MAKKRREPLYVAGGKWKRSRLYSGPTDKLKPTTELVRASVFNILQDQIHGARFLDLYAGTGAVGIEALSRGARHVTFVEWDARNVALIRKNLQKFGALPQARILRMDVRQALRTLDAEGEPFEVIFLDPPYAEPQACPMTLEFLSISRLIKPGTSVVVQSHRSLVLRERYGPLVLRKRYPYGVTVLWVYDFWEDADSSLSGDV